jgi:hypothetical protein
VHSALIRECHETEEEFVDQTLERRLSEARAPKSEPAPTPWPGELQRRNYSVHCALRAGLSRVVGY